MNALISRTSHRAAEAKVAYYIFILLLPLLLFTAMPRFAHAAAPAGSSISNQASATYTDAALGTHSVTSNTVVTVVQQVASLTLASNGAKTAAPGGQVVYAHSITNTGNGAD